MATVMAIALILIAAGQLANVIDFHAAYPLMLGGVCCFAVLVGFALGCWSRRGAWRRVCSWICRNPAGHRWSIQNSCESG